MVWLTVTMNRLYDSGIGRVSNGTGMRRWWFDTRVWFRFEGAQGLETRGAEGKFGYTSSSVGGTNTTSDESEMD
jgi:hypothetical protein